eukprot:15481557-Alexandrium_andersonii.AAC.1
MLQKDGWQVSIEVLLATEVGELIARKRQVLLATRNVSEDQQLWAFEALGLRRPIAPAFGPILLPAA